VNNNSSLVRLLLERGAEIDDGESIYHAAQFDHRESMEVLREFGVSLGRHPRWKNTPLYFLLEHPPGQSSWNATVRGIRWLLDQGSDPNIPCGDKDETVLHAAIRQNHEMQIIGWLLDAGADPNRPDRDGMLPLRLARRAGGQDLIALLLKHGATEVELTPKERFFEAAFSGDRENALRLLREEPGLEAAFDEEDRLALNRAAERGRIDAVCTLLDAGFDIAFKGTRDWSATPLHLAAWYGWADAVEVLLSRGAPIDVPANPPENSPPLVWAAHGSGKCKNPEGDYVRVVQLLLGAGAEPSAGLAEMASPEVADVIHGVLAGSAQ
jgi:ankyrin repeat protein